MAGQDVFVFAGTEVAAGQAVMFDIIHQFQLPDGDKGLQREQGHALGTAEDACKGEHADLQGGVAPERVCPVRGGQVFAGQHCSLGMPCGAGALPQHAGEIAVKAFVIARGDGIFRGADVQMVDAQMFGAEMGIKDARHQQIGQPTLGFGFLVHEFMGIGDADGAGNDAHAEEEADFFRHVKVGGVGRVPDEREQERGLHRKPDQRDEAVPVKIGIRRGGIGIVAGLADEGVEHGKQAPGADGGEQDGQPAEMRADDAERHHGERGPERQGVCEAGLGCLHVGALWLGGG